MGLWGFDRDHLLTRFVEHRFELEGFVIMYFPRLIRISDYYMSIFYLFTFICLLSKITTQN